MELNINYSASQFGSNKRKENKMEELNYVLVGKQSTIECLLSGEIKADEMSKFYVLDFLNRKIRPLGNVCTEDIILALDDPEVLFMQEDK